MTPFGITQGGTPVERYSLRTDDLEVSILTYGAIVQDVRLRGVDDGLTQGSECLADYETTMPSYGPLIGPVVNRITGAQAQIAGRICRFDANQDRRITLHSGSANTGAQVWTVEDAGPTVLQMSLTLEDGAGGFPGNRKITVRYDVLPPATLQMQVTGVTDAPTLMNFANHSYWTLDTGGGFANSSLRIAADRYLPTTRDATPTGEISTVEGTPFDFRTERILMPGAPPLDTNFCLSDRPTDLRDVAWLTSDTGVTLTMATTMPGLQVYDARPDYRAIALEAQHWPDAPNHAEFPSILLQPEETYSQITQWAFSSKTP